MVSLFGYHGAQDPFDVAAGGSVRATLRIARGTVIMLIKRQILYFESRSEQDIIKNAIKSEAGDTKKVH